ncbi:ArsC/Spx/MgsR family protein [Marinicella rhabdoformis]|uniref:ArsC/Spx/MgsR family protein n=1 Tax=Marinicella rhabdoformis TaxID=2580566 RepID=UPI0012AED5DB|nr:ArsC/Spx/MgsR family protein [Marinicella rhabdoformis]
MIIYGIKNCDKVRAAMKSAKADCKNGGPDTKLHDFRVHGIDENLVNAMLADIELSQLLNKRSTTWKQLDEFQKIEPNVGLLVANPTLIKRPVVFDGKNYRIGY